MSREAETRRLTEAIEAFAAARAPELVADAQAEALARARTMLTDALAESLLANSAELLQPAERPTARNPRPARQAKAGKRAPKRARPARPRAQKPRPVPPSDREARADLGHYVYGVAFAPGELPDKLEGVDARFGVGLIAEGDLAAITSPVSLAEFGEETLRENLNDVSWLEEKARAHESVLEGALQRATVVPMRLCTIYSGEEQVREMLRTQHDTLLDALVRLEGKAEWGVKLIAEPGALERVVTERSGSHEDEGVSSGTAYMNRKRHLARTREEELQLAEDWAREAHEQLADASHEALLNPLQRPDVGGYEGDMLLNGVYLVEDEHFEEFQALADRLADEYRRLGVALELTGPWPPYNFVKSSIEAAR